MAHRTDRILAFQMTKFGHPVQPVLITQPIHGHLFALLDSTPTESTSLLEVLCSTLAESTSQLEVLCLTPVESTSCLEVLCSTLAESLYFPPRSSLLDSL